MSSVLQGKFLEGWGGRNTENQGTVKTRQMVLFMGVVSFSVNDSYMYVFLEPSKHLPAIATHSTQHCNKQQQLS
jgi:hypothetical protein